VGRAADPTADQGGEGSVSPAYVQQADALKSKLKSRPRDRALKVALGNLHYDNERWIDATLTLREALDEDPGDDATRVKLANCYYFVGNPDLAVQLHEEVLRRKPEDPDSLFFLGAFLADSRRQDRAAQARAVEVWTAFLRVRPDAANRADVERRLAGLRAALGEAAPAVAAPAPAPASAPARGPAPVGAVEAAVEQRRAEARRALEEKRFPDARRAAEAALALGAEDGETGTLHARAVMQMGQVAEAVKLFEAIIQAHPTYGPAWHYLGMAQMLGNNPAAAAKAWRQVVAKDPAYAAQHRLGDRAAVAEKMGGP
jgi:predicted Zn-dependent protease